MTGVSPLTWSLATSRKDSLVRGGYHTMEVGVALCSMRSTASRRRSSVRLFVRSYSTWGGGGGVSEGVRV